MKLYDPKYTKTICPFNISWCMINRYIYDEKRRCTYDSPVVLPLIEVCVFKFQSDSFLWDHIDRTLAIKDDEQLTRESHRLRISYPAVAKLWEKGTSETPQFVKCALMGSFVQMRPVYELLTKTELLTKLL